MMRITDVREMAVPLAGAVSNAVVSFEHHRVSLVAVFADVTDRNGSVRQIVGLAFNSIGRHSQGGILRDRMIPRLLTADPESLVSHDDGVVDPSAVLATVLADEKPGGHGDRSSAAAAIELACWDLVAKYHGEPAYQTIARAHGRKPVSAGVPVYAAGGYYRSDRDLVALQDELRGYFDAGYVATKIKIGGMSLSDDLRRIEAALVVAGSGERLAVDANGRFGREQALAYADAIEPYGLRWYEEPVDPLAYGLHSELAGAYDGALATGENLFSVQDTENLLSFAGLRPDRDILQMDAGLSYGLTEYVRMIETMEAHGFDRRSAMPHGGHLINLHIVTGLGLGGCEAYPGVFQPFGGYSSDCVLADGMIRPGQSPGFGLEAKTELVESIDRLLGDR